MAAATDNAPAQPAQPQADGDIFNGRIVSMNGQYFVLRDDSNGVWYHLDDQNKVRPFAGKIVSVKGVLDGRTDEIHIQSIEEQQR